LFFYSKSKELDKAKHYNLMDCIECGACSFVCPSQIPLVQYFRFGKGEVRKAKIESDKSDRARIRFEAHQERLEKEAAAKELKRQQRAEAAAAKKERLAKAKLEKAAAEAANPSLQESPQESPAENSDADEALETLKSNATKASKRFQQAKKALQMAEKSGADHIDKLRDKILQLESKANDAKQALKEALAAAPTSTADKQASASEPAQPTDTTKAAENTDTSQIIAAATARVKLKKAQKALDAAQASDTPNAELITHLQTGLDSARAELEQYAPSEPTTGEAQ